MSEEQLLVELRAMELNFTSKIRELQYMLRLVAEMTAYIKGKLLEKIPDCESVQAPPKKKLKVYKTREERLARNLEILKDKATGVT